MRHLNDPALIPESFCSDERLQAKFAWLLEYRREVELWSGWLALIDASLDLVRRSGYGNATNQAITPLMEKLSDSEVKSQLANELITIIKNECSKVAIGGRVPGSTEILESSFGKLKSIEGDQSKSGFTSLLLAWPALFGTTTMSTIQDAMTAVTTKLVHTWVDDNLGFTVHSKRAQLAHALRNKSTGNQEDT